MLLWVSQFPSAPETSKRIIGSSILLILDTPFLAVFWKHVELPITLWIDAEWHWRASYFASPAVFCFFAFCFGFCVEPLLGSLSGLVAPLLAASSGGSSCLP